MADNAGIDALEVGLVGVDFVLNMIGFDLVAEREGIMEAGLNQFEDFRYLTEKDIRDMADDFAKRTIADRRIVFGLGRTKKLVGVLHWIQDCYRADDVPDHANFNMAILYESLSLAQIRKSDIERVTTNTKAADPGKFKDERKVVVAEGEVARKRRIIRQRSGRSYRTRNEIKSGKCEIERASREEPSETSPK